MVCDAYKTPFIQTVALCTRQDQGFRDLQLPINIHQRDGLHYNVPSLCQLPWEIGILFAILEWGTVFLVEIFVDFVYLAFSQSSSR